MSYPVKYIEYLLLFLPNLLCGKLTMSPIIRQDIQYNSGFRSRFRTGEYLKRSYMGHQGFSRAMCWEARLGASLTLHCLWRMEADGHSVKMVMNKISVDKAVGPAEVNFKKKRVIFNKPLFGHINRYNSLKVIIIILYLKDYVVHILC